MDFKEIVIPQIDVNDDKVTIESLEFEDGQKVNKDDVIFSVSTAKSVEDFICEYSGFIVFNVEDGDEVKIGTTVAFVFETKEIALRKSEEIQQKRDAIVTYSASKKAIKYANEILFNLVKIKKDGIIKVKDIKEYIEMNGE